MTAVPEIVRLVSGLSEEARVRSQNSLCEVCRGQSGTETGSSPSIPRVIPQISRYFKWQPSARVSQIIWSSHFNHMIAATTYQRPSVHLGPLIWPRYTGQTVQIIYYPGSDQTAPHSHSGFRCVFGARKVPQEYWPLLSQKHRRTRTRLRAFSPLGIWI